ncbi:MAG TPA: AMP-binding protein [Trebonia sp.]|nr:AMP-binding protein [Trebonia sp.]
MHRPDDHADKAPDAAAVIVPATGQRISYRTMVDQSKRLANVLRSHGLRPGDHVAIFMTNVPEYFEVVWAARRAGYFYTAVSWHLTPGEVRYMLENSESKALIASADLADVAGQAAEGLPWLTLRLLVGAGEADPGWDDYAATVATAGTDPLGPEIEGQAMLYSSGTTGRPKGIVHTRIDTGRRFGDVDGDILWVNRYGLDQSTVTLNVGPLYHAAPLVSAMSTHRHGGTVLLPPKFDAEQTLQAIDRYRVTYAQFVPTMFIRLLRLPEEVRRRYDVSSLRAVAHSAAPCPVDVKRRMIEWFGPVINEYYSATEAAGLVSIGSSEWLEHPGSVGRTAPGSVAITGETGRELPPGEDGTIWFTRPANKFSYHNDPDKSASMFNDKGWARMGDIGHLDGDGYLFITGRSDHTIISGGVNIYPREIEDLLIEHPAVDDVAVIGVPDDEYGESVKAVVTLREGYAGDAVLERDIIDWTRARLAHYKCPRSVTFVASLPRSVAGKMMKHRLIEQLKQESCT